MQSRSLFQVFFSSLKIGWFKEEKNDRIKEKAIYRFFLHFDRYPRYYDLLGVGLKKLFTTWLDNPCLVAAVNVCVLVLTAVPLITGCGIIYRSKPRSTQELTVTVHNNSELNVSVSAVLPLMTNRSQEIAAMAAPIRRARWTFPAVGRAVSNYGIFAFL